MATIRLSRRHTAIAGGLWALVGGAVASGEAAAVPERGNLARLFHEPAAARLLGARLLAMETDMGALRARLATFTGTPSDEAPARFRQTVEADFRAGRLVVVGGWVLARSEADLCAGLALDEAA